MRNEQVELGGIILTDKRRKGEEKKINAGKIVVDTMAEKSEEQEKFEAKKRKEWEEFKQETAEIDPDLLAKTEEELAAEEYGLNPDGTKREERKDMSDSHKKIDVKRRFKKGVIGKGDAPDKFNESEYPPHDIETGVERQSEEKIENPELAEKINKMVKLSGELWDLSQESKKTRETYETINEISKKLIPLYYRNVKKELGDPDNIYKIEGVNEESAKRARGAIGRIENGEAFIKIGYMKINNGDLEKLLDIDKKIELNETVKMANEAISSWGKDKILLRIEEGQKPEYLVKFFDPERGDVELETKGGEKAELRTLYLYAVNFDKANKEIKAEEKKTTAKETPVPEKKEAEAEETEKIELNPELTEKINRLAELYKERGKEYQNLEGAKERGRQVDIDELYEKMNLITKEMMILYYRDIKEKIEQDKINTDNFEKNFGENGKKAKEAIEKINKIEPENISRQSFEKLAEIKDKRKEEEILTVFKDRKTLLRIKENAKREYVLVTYNSGAEYSYIETLDGKDRQRARSKDIYVLNADVIDNIEKIDAEAAK